MIKDYIQSEWLGLNTRIKDPKNLKKGESQDSLNWLTAPKNDHIELRMGQALLGATRQTGAGKITGLNVGTRDDGTTVPFFTHGQKVKYYDSVTDDTIEVSSDVLGSAAASDDVSIEPYSNIAGNWIYISSPNSSIYKIAVANPGSILDLVSTTYRGRIKIDQSRMFLWSYIVLVTGFSDKTTPILSYIDHSLLSDYTTVSAENYASGDGVAKTFAHTLAQVPGADKQTAFSVTVTDGTETFLDNKNGVMVGSLGGTGTVNYVSGAVSVTFNTAPGVGVNNITTTYQYEKKTASIVDFTHNSPRTAGQGDFFAQYGGGNLMNIFPFNSIEYCLHILKTWALTIGLDDTSATNLPYRSGVGIPYWRAGWATDDAIIYLDYLDKTNPMVRQLILQQYSSNVIPDPLSESLDLSKNGFDFPVVFSWGDYYLLSCQGITNSVNDTANNFSYLYNKISGLWDKLDVGFTCATSYLGKFLFGDPVSNNVFQLFSGYDDDGSVINNYWISHQTNCEAEGLKRAYRFLIDGYINAAQSFDIYAAYDHGNYTLIGTISGSGSYVDTASGVLVGSDTVGLQVVGSGATVNAFHFRNEFVIASDIFEYVTVKFVATGIGALQINQFGFRDLRYKGRRTIPIYETTA